jgi:hypothetical protein
MNRIAKAAERVERLEAIRQAHDEGAKPATIARVAGLSRERIRQIVSTS